MSGRRACVLTKRCVCSEITQTHIHGALTALLSVFPTGESGPARRRGSTHSQREKRGAHRTHGSLPRPASRTMAAEDKLSNPCRTTQHTLLSREYWLHTPCCRTTTDDLRPLVIMLHGWGDRAGEYAGVQVASPYAWRAGADRWTDEAEAACFHVAWPQGVIGRNQVSPAAGTSSWNAGGCSNGGGNLCAATSQSITCFRDSCHGACSPCAWCSCTDDVGFITQLAQFLLASDLGIDRQRIFLAGCSNGGMMTWEVALHGPPGLFAAFATNCGVPHVGYMCTPPRPFNLIHIHAGNDHVIPFDGSPATDGAYRYTSADDALAAVTTSTLGGCQNGTSTWHSLHEAYAHPQPISESPRSALPWLDGIRLARRNATDDFNDGRCRLRASCADDVELVLCTGNFAHDWPAWAAAVTWRFFEHVTRNVSNASQGVVGESLADAQPLFPQCRPRSPPPPYPPSFPPLPPSFFSTRDSLDLAVVLFVALGALFMLLRRRVAEGKKSNKWSKARAEAAMDDSDIGGGFDMEMNEAAIAAAKSCDKKGDRK